MSVSSTNLSGNNVTAFNRYRRLAAEKARAEAEAQKAQRKPKKQETKPEAVCHEPFSDVPDVNVETEPKDPKDGE